MNYRSHVIEVRQTAEFAQWLKGLKDRAAQTRIAARLLRLESGNFGDFKALKEGLFELRFAFGPGYRVYFIKHGDDIVILLGGGEKAAKQKTSKVPENERGRWKNDASQDRRLRKI